MVFFFKKWPFFSFVFFFPPNKTKKAVWHYSTQKRMFSRQEKISFKKVHKMEIFQKTQSMVFVKNWPFPLLFFFPQSKTKKTTSNDFRQKRMFSRQEKLSFYKVKKFDIFQRGQSVVFVKKWPFSTFVFFPQNKTEKTTWHYSGQKRMLSRRGKLSFKKVKKKKKKEILQRDQSMVFVKKWPFPLLFFFSQNKTNKSTSHYFGQKRMFSRQEK